MVYFVVSLGICDEVGLFLFDGLYITAISHSSPPLCPPNSPVLFPWNNALATVTTRNEMPIARPRMLFYLPDPTL